MDVGYFQIGDVVEVKPLADARRDFLYGRYVGTITRFCGEDGPDCEAFIETDHANTAAYLAENGLSRQSVSFRQWILVSELVVVRNVRALPDRKAS